METGPRPAEFGSQMPDFNEGDDKDSKNKKKKTGRFAAAFGIAKEEKTPEVTDEKPPRPSISLEEILKERSDKSKESEASPTSELSAEEHEELKEKAQELIELGLDDAEGVLHDMPLEETGTVRAAEAAAVFDYYQTMERDLESNPDITSLPDAAAAEVAGHIAAEPEEEVSAEIEPDEFSETQESPEFEETFEEEDARLTDSQIPPPRSGMPPFNPGRPAGPGGPGAPEGPGWSGAPYYFNAAPNMPPPMPDMVSRAEAAQRESSAAGSGLLVGGVLGYLVGRHRGRKQGVKTAEKKAKPIRENLEKQVQSLNRSMESKEAHLKALARDRINDLQGKKDKEQFVRNILDQSVAEKQSVRKPEASVSAERERAGKDIARTLAESPLLAAAAAVPAVERKPVEVIPFNKNVKDFSQSELLAAAEKVKVEGTTLREMVELGRIDESGLRNVVGEFIRGGDVEKALINETKVRELKYEQDPQLRRAQAAQGQGSSQSVGAGGLALGGLLGVAQPGDQSGYSGSGSKNLGSVKRPELTLEQQRALRNQQIQAVSVTALVVTVFVVLIIAIM